MDLWSGFWGAILGGLLTAIGSVGTVRYQIKSNRTEQKANQDRILKGYLQAIHDEVETIWNRYSKGVGSSIVALPKNQPFLIIFPIGHDYFTIYNSNAFLIGQIRDSDVRRLIVKSYTTSKGLIDSYRLNNELVQKYENANFLFLQTKQQAHQQMMQLYLQSLVGYAERLKEGHDEVRQAVEQLLPAIRQSVELSKY